MPVQARYMSVDEFKIKGRGEMVSTDEDESIGAFLDAASRQIDGFCGRAFGQSDTPESRIYYYENLPITTYLPAHQYDVDDFVSISAIAGDDGSGAFSLAWDLTRLVSMPRNAAAANEAFTSFGFSFGPSGITVLPGYLIYGIQVTGIWGWPSVPAPVVEVCYQLANRMRTLQGSPFGVMGSENELGAVRMSADFIGPIMRQLLAQYRALTV